MVSRFVFSAFLISVFCIALGQRTENSATSRGGVLSFVSSSPIQTSGPSIRKIHWRGSDQSIEVKLTPFEGNAKDPIYLSVWVLGRPNTAINGRPVPADQVGRIAFIERLEPGTRDLTTKIEFASFAPPVPGKKKSPYSGFVVQGSGAPAGLASISKTMAAMVREATLARLSRDGTTQYTLVATQGKVSSNLLTVEYGELMASPSKAESLAQTQYATAEFPDEKFGPAGTLSPLRGSMGLRYRLPQGTKKALFQICQNWEHPGYALWTTVKPTLQVDLPLDKKDSKDSSFLRTSVPTVKFAGDLDQTRYWGRVVPLDSQGNLAGKPSDPVSLVVSNPPAPVKSEAKPKLTFTYELVGWRPGYEANPMDQYRFVISSKNAPFGALNKIAGKQLKQGDKVYLPPSPPPDEKAWYEKVVDFIAEAIAFFDSYFTFLASAIGTNLGVIKQLPFSIAEEIGLPKSASASIQKAINAPLKLESAAFNAASRVTSAPSYLTERMLDELGVESSTKRAAVYGNYRGALANWARKNVWENQAITGMGLTPDPDFEQRTGVAYVRVTAGINPSLPQGYRESFYPVSMEVHSIAKDASSLGISSQTYQLYQATGLPCSLAPGQSVLVPIVMDYHWTYDSRKADWLFGWTKMETTRFVLNGKSITNKNLHKQWGTVSE